MSGQATPSLRARATHLYPGARLLAEVPVTPGPVLVAFSDGMETVATVEADGASFAVPAHVTARGARIPPKRWRLAADPGGYRIAARAEDA